jgi:hypothetical protein
MLMLQPGVTFTLLLLLLLFPCGALPQEWCGVAGKLSQNTSCFPADAVPELLSSRSWTSARCLCCHCSS